MVITDEPIERLVFQTRLNRALITEVEPQELEVRKALPSAVDRSSR